MTSSEKAYRNRPLEHLGRLLKGKIACSPTRRKPSTPAKRTFDDATVSPKSDRELFLDAVRDVRPLHEKQRSIATRRAKALTDASTGLEVQETYQKLKHLLAFGEGFDVSQTPEYMEGTGHHVPRAAARHLHQGRFSIQDHIDLHGMDALGAAEALEYFLKKSTEAGLRSVLVIHGRGLSSPGEPVLKTMLRQLLSSNRWRRWILAFSSARGCDGGTGATYVLFRKKPLTRQARKTRIPEKSVDGDRMP